MTPGRANRTIDVYVRRIARSQHVATVDVVPVRLGAINGDWPDHTACRARSPLLVQYHLDDDLFTPQGTRDADAKLDAHHASVGHLQAYAG